METISFEEAVTELLLSIQKREFAALPENTVFTYIDGKLVPEEEITCLKKKG